MKKNMVNRGIDEGTAPFDETGEMVLIDQEYLELVSGGGNISIGITVSGTFGGPPSTPPAKPPPPPPPPPPPQQVADNGGDDSGGGENDGGDDGGYDGGDNELA